jgi:Type I restriction modification DNA specificity domain
VLYPKFELNQFIAMFLISLIKKEKYRFNYGRKWHKERMEYSTIKLPVTPSGDPDWKYMEDCTKQLFKKIEAKINPKPLVPKTLELNVEKWVKFKLSELFEFENGKITTLDGVKKGNIPIATSTTINNGIQDFIDNEEVYSGNRITLSIRGGGNCFYQQSNFCATLNAMVLTPKTKFNKYIGIFLITILDQEKFRYCYGRIRAINKCKQEIINLPITPQGDPDWQFMEDYIKSLPYSSSLV